MKVWNVYKRGPWDFFSKGNAPKEGCESFPDKRNKWNEAQQNE